MEYDVMDYLMLWGALIAALATIAVAIVQGITLYMIGQVQAHASVQTIATVEIKKNVDKLEVNTNSISERLEALAKAQGIVVGRKQVEQEMAERDRNIAAGKKQEQADQAAKPA